MHNISLYIAEKCQEISVGDGETRGARLVIPEHPQQLLVPPKWRTSLDVPCLKVVDDHGTSSASGGISSRDSSLSHHHPLLVVQQRWTILEHPCHIALYKLNCIVLLLLYMYIVYDSPLNLLDIGL